MKAGFYNSGMNGQTRGFYLYPVQQVPYLWLWGKTIYEFDLDPTIPLTFVGTDGIWYRPNKSFQTDMGSIPRMLRTMIDKDRFIGFFFHDSGYMEKGLWVSDDKGVNWYFRAMQRAEIDHLLAVMISHDPCPGNLVTACAIWAAVKSFGWMSYGKGDEKDKPASTSTR